MELAFEILLTGIVVYLLVTINKLQETVFAIRATMMADRALTKEHKPCPPE